MTYCNLKENNQIYTKYVMVTNLTESSKTLRSRKSYIYSNLYLQIFKDPTTSRKTKITAYHPSQGYLSPLNELVIQFPENRAHNNY